MQGFHPEIRRAEESRHPVPLLILPLAGSPASRPGRGGPRPGSRPAVPPWPTRQRSEEHTSELQSLMRISYAVFCLKKKKHKQTQHIHHLHITSQTKLTTDD